MDEIVDNFVKHCSDGMALVLLSSSDFQFNCESVGVTLWYIENLLKHNK